jgi:glutathione S-transferase
VKLYDFKQAPNPRRVRIFLAEKGIEVPMVQVDLGKREQREESFQRINPLMRVPVLELDDGTCIAESVAICRYFEVVQPEPPLFGTDAKDQALVEMWNRRIELNLMGNVSAGFRHTSEFFAGLVEQVPDWGEQNKRNAAKEFGWLNDVLAEREFVAGDRYTIADITALCSVDFAKVIKLRPTEDQPHLQRWHAAVSARPSAGA